MKPKPVTPEPDSPARKWWVRIADGDWRWADQSWQTEAQATAIHKPKERPTHENHARN